MHPELSLLLSDTKKNWIERQCRKDEAYLWKRDRMGRVPVEMPMTRKEWPGKGVYGFIKSILP